MTIRVRRVASKDDLTKALSIRKRVFVREQGVSEAIETDRYDARAIHFLALTGNQPIGTARVVICHGTAKIGRMAVLKKYRGTGVGTRLLKNALGAARRGGARKVYLHAQVPVIGFYERMNFRCVGEVFSEAGISHRKMIWNGGRRVARL